MERAALRVVAANAAGVNGAAGRTVTRLQQLGYTQSTAADASKRRAATVVLFLPGFRAAAERLAVDLGLPATSVARMTDTSIVTTPVTADLIVLVGKDLA